MANYATGARSKLQMKIGKFSVLALAVILLSSAASIMRAQTPSLLKRTTTKTDKFDFSAGGTVTIAGAPSGSIRIVGSVKNQVEITAEIELQASSEADL